MPSSSSSGRHLPQYFLLFLAILFVQLRSGTGKLEHLQLFFRHGERTPTSFLSFPTEAKREVPSELDLGEMTQEGMWQEYRLGIQLAHFYGQFLGDKYRSKEVKIYSGLDNRTVASAQLVLAGLFPPHGNQVWNRALLWQPIPVETEVILDHPSFGMFDYCPAEKARVEGTEGYKRMEQKFAGEMADLQEKTGLAIPNLDMEILQKVLDAIVTRSELPQLLPLPAWARPADYVEHIRKCRLELHEGLIDLFLDGMGGWHFDQLLGKMDDFVQNRTQQKAVLYSGHDTNFVTFGRYLGIPPLDDLFPSYASLLAFELHAEGEQHFVQVNFRMGLDGNFTRLQITKCPEPCSLDQFRRLQPRISTPQWLIRCKGLPKDIDGTEQCSLYGPIAGALLVLVVLLLASALSLLLSCRSYKRRYEQLAKEERSPLLFNGRPNIEAR